MRAIVLVKQVPDVRSAPVGIRPDGTIDRRGSTPITNPADLHAIEAALQLCDEVVALSMGPAAADSTLREAISLNPYRPEWHFNLGLTLEAAGRNGDAATAWALSRWAPVWRVCLKVRGAT